MKALSVRQPWAWLLFHGKSVENRDWYTAYRGPLVICASKAMTPADYEAARLFVRSFDPELAARIPHPGSLVYGHALGTVEQIGCVSRHSSPWFCGEFGHVYTNPRLFQSPIPVKGQLGLFEWQGPVEGLRYVEGGVITGDPVECGGLFAFERSEDAGR